MQNKKQSTELQQITYIFIKLQAQPYSFLEKK